jgi:hypothetical protein
MNNEKPGNPNPLMSDEMFGSRVDIDLDDLGSTAAAPLGSPEKRPSNPLMGSEIVSIAPISESLGAWRAVQFKATDGKVYIAHRVSDLGYTVTVIDDAGEDGRLSTTISIEDAATINFMVGTLLKVGEKTVQVKEITHQIR